MKVLVDWWDMGSFPWLVPYEEGECDVRRTVEVPEDLYARLVDAHEEFCSVLSEVDVKCVEILNAPDPASPRLARTRVQLASHHAPDDSDLYAWRAVCEACGSAEEVECARPGPLPKGPREGAGGDHLPGLERAPPRRLRLPWVPRHGSRPGDGGERMSAPDAGGRWAGRAAAKAMRAVGFLAWVTFCTVALHALGRSAPEEWGWGSGVYGLGYGLTVFGLAAAAINLFAHRPKRSLAYVAASGWIFLAVGIGEGWIY